MKKTVKRPTWLSSQILTLTLIVLLGGMIRVAQLATLPSTLNRDEAALAYNACLLKETGKDEWGRSWPVSLESFGDYKLPGYPLLLVGTFSLFGVNDFAVRLPSAVAGTILIALSYFFARKVLNLQPLTCLIVASIIALQPVFFFYSRMAWEANVALTFFVTAVTLFLSEMFSQVEPWKVDVAALLLTVLAVFTYNTPLLLLPFIAVAIILQRGLKSWRKWLFPILGLGLVFLVGLVTFSSISQQKSGITIFSDETTWSESVSYYESFSGWQQKLFGNRYVFFGKVMLQHYWESVSPIFLVQKGGQHPWHSIPNNGHIFIATYVLSIIAAGRLLWVSVSPKTNHNTRFTAIMLLFLLVTSLAPSVITVDAPHATRSLFFFFLLCVSSGIALEWMWKVVSADGEQKQAFQVFFVALLLVGCVNEVHAYYFKYFTFYPKQSSEILKAGLGTQLQKMEERVGNSPEQVAVVDPDGFLYISAAWELRMSPEQFYATINHHLPDRIGLKYGYRVGRYRFIANREDRLPEDTHLIEWDPVSNRWITDQNL